MSIDIKYVKRKLLIRYSFLGSVLANLEFKESNEIKTAETDGKVVLYNQNFVNGLTTEKEKIFVFAHEVFHVAFDHIFRRENKDPMYWNIAADAVINALLRKDGWTIIKGAVDIPEAADYDVEEMYEKLIKEKEEQQESQQGPENGKEQGNDIKQDKKLKAGHDTHNLWDKAIEERKKEQQKEPNEQKENELVKKGEKEVFEQNRKEREQQLRNFSNELAEQSSHKVETKAQRQEKKLSDIGIAVPLIDWRRLLRQATKYNEDWTRRNARMRNGYFKYKITRIPLRETEILLDTSGSVSENLLKNFLKECKMIIQANSKVKVGCFNTEFYGFTEIKRIEDIDNMHFPIGGGTNFNVAEEAFSANVPNKVIFTDGKAKMPEKIVRNVIWVVFGTVINIKDDQLKELYRSRQENKSNDINR